MSIFLTILKIIGIILLIILLIILAVLLLLLFVPFRYSAGGRKEGDVLEFSGKVTWLLHAVTVQIGFEPGGAGLTKDLRIFGISLFKLRDKLKSRKKSTGHAESSIEGSAEKKTGDVVAVQEAKEASPDPGSGKEEGGEENSSAETSSAGESEGTLQDVGEEAAAKQQDTGEEAAAKQQDAGEEAAAKHQDIGAETSGPEGRDGEEFSDESPESGKTKASDGKAPDATVSAGEGSLTDQPAAVTSRIKAVYNKLTDIAFSALSNIAKRLNGIIGKLFGLALKIFIKICLLPLTIVVKLDKIFRKIGGICRKIGAFADFFFDEKVQSFLSEITGLVKKLIGHVLPKKLKGYVRFGLDDPGRTGRVLAAVAPFYPKYGKTFSLQPDFEDLVFEGNAELKGRGYLFYVAYIGLRAILKRNLKYVIRQFKKLKEFR